MGRGVRVAHAVKVKLAGRDAAADRAHQGQKRSPDDERDGVDLELAGALLAAHAVSRHESAVLEKGVVDERKYRPVHFRWLEPEAARKHPYFVGPRRHRRRAPQDLLGALNLPLQLRERRDGEQLRQVVVREL